MRNIYHLAYIFYSILINLNFCVFKEIRLLNTLLYNLNNGTTYILLRILINIIKSTTNLYKKKKIKKYYLNTEKTCIGFQIEFRSTKIQ